MGTRELKQIHEAHVMNMSPENVIARFEALGFSTEEVERAVRAEYETEIDAESEGLCE
jgi:hypothetical protein